jgi:hypothetical protein
MCVHLQVRRLVDPPSVGGDVLIGASQPELAVSLHMHQPRRISGTEHGRLTF